MRLSLYLSFACVGASVFCAPSYSMASMDVQALQQEIKRLSAELDRERQKNKRLANVDDGRAEIVEPVSAVEPALPANLEPKKEIMPAKKLILPEMEDQGELQTTVRPVDYVIRPRTDVYVKRGTDRSLIGVEAFTPFHWDGKDLLFADVRFVGDDGSEREGNVGVGWRRVLKGREAILGV
jgi:hypothetical protein